MKVEFVERYKSRAGVECYRWKVVEGQGILRKMSGTNPHITVQAGDFILIGVAAFWNGEARFVREVAELRL